MNRIHTIAVLWAAKPEGAILLLNQRANEQLSQLWVKKQRAIHKREESTGLSLHAGAHCTIEAGMGIRTYCYAHLHRQLASGKLAQLLKHEIHLAKEIILACGLRLRQSAYLLVQLLL